MTNFWTYLRNDRNWKCCNVKQTHILPMSMSLNTSTLAPSINLHISPAVRIMKVYHSVCAEATDRPTNPSTSWQCHPSGRGYCTQWVMLVCIYYGARILFRVYELVVSLRGKLRQKLLVVDVVFVLCFSLWCMAIKGAPIYEDVLLYSVISV